MMSQSKWLEGCSIQESLRMHHLTFHGLQSDIQDIERHFLGGINRFFEAAEEMKNNFFDVFGDFHNGNPSSSPSKRRGVPIEGHPLTEASPEPKEPSSGNVDLSGLARDV
ncbi:hypothetical protein OIU78_019754 [Salix suchowensis]|nr:hypothetical protein OIU78_019754 [Salix suchowensis]